VCERIRFREVWARGYALKETAAIRLASGRNHAKKDRAGISGKPAIAFDERGDHG